MYYLTRPCVNSSIRIAFTGLRKWCNLFCNIEIEMAVAGRILTSPSPKAQVIQAQPSPKSLRVKSKMGKSTGLSLSTASLVSYYCWLTADFSGLKLNHSSCRRQYYEMFHEISWSLHLISNVISTCNGRIFSGSGPREVIWMQIEAWEERGRWEIQKPLTIM